MLVYKQLFLGFLCLLALLLPQESVHTQPSRDFTEEYFVDTTVTLSHKISQCDSIISCARKKGDDRTRIRFSNEKVQFLILRGDYKAAIELSKKNIQDIRYHLEEKDSEWDHLYMNAVALMATAKLNNNEQEGAIDLIKSVLSSRKYDTLSKGTAQCYNILGTFFSNNGYYTLADDYFRRSFRIYEKIKDIRGQYLVLCNLGGNYISMNKNEEALKCFLRVQDIVISEKYYREEKIYSLFYLATVYSEMENYKLSEVYYQEALVLVDRMQIPHLEIFVNYEYANSLYERKEYASAKKYAEKVLSKARKLHSKQVEINVLNLLGNIASLQGDDKTANRYLRQGYTLREQVYSKEREEQLLHLKVDFENYKQKQEQKLKDVQLDLAKTSLKKRTLQVILLCVFCLMALAGLLVFWKKILKQYKITRQKDSQIQEIRVIESQKAQILKDEFSKELSSKDKELTVNALFFLRINGLHEDLRRRLKELKVLLSTKGKEKVMVLEMERLLEEFASEKGWKDFEICFTNIEKDFFYKLSLQCPQLTDNEKRLCALMRLNLNNNEISNILNRSVASVTMAKTRLKKRIGIQDDTKLNEFLQSIE